MIGLFGTLNLGQRSLQVQQQGVQVAGHNLANVNNPAYARQRLRIQTAAPVALDGQQVGTGAEVAAVTQFRSQFLDRQIQTEASVTGYLEARQRTLQQAQTNLGQMIDRMAAGAEGSAAATGVGGQHGIAENLTDFFNAWQSLAASPADPTERLILVQRAESLAANLRQTDRRLADLQDALDDSLADDVAHVNRLLEDVATLNNSIARAEQNGSGLANDLRDSRQEKMEALARFLRVDVASGEHGQINVFVGGVELVHGGEVADTLETADAGQGRLELRTQQADIAPSLTGGSLRAAIEVRDGELQQLRDRLGGLAGVLITEVNAVHRTGFGLGGTTGADFFQGTTAADVRVNSALVEDPARIQASGSATARGDNTIALAVAGLVTKEHASLAGLTFNESYGQAVAGLGQALATVNDDATDQQVITQMLQRQRDSIGGVSLDEEMTDLVKYQRAYQASARLINTIDTMFDEVLNLKR